MLKLIKKLFSTGDGKQTVVILNDDGSKAYTSHQFSPVNLWILCISILAGLVILVVFLMTFTPLGGFVYNQQKMHDSVVDIQQQVVALQDSIRARNMQLQNLRRVLITGEDSVFISSQAVDSLSNAREFEASSQSQTIRYSSDFEMQDNSYFISNMLQSASDFPTSWPVEGTLTRRFNSSNDHHGIDIAASSGDSFSAIADGVIIGKNWSMNYGYVLYIQHSNHIITVYKHASHIEKNVGQSVQKGDVLGRVGDAGIISSGPHLHLELWKNGIPQNPLHYLIKS